MVAIWSKIPPPAQWLNSKATGIAVASVAAGILVLWKKKLDDLSRKRYFFAFDANISLQFTGLRCCVIIFL